jgi:predicted enzyme related to lactoylglutathione lyase
MEVSQYDHGRSAWADVGAPDPGAARRFYEEMFGWESQDMGEDTGHYTMFAKHGRPVAALRGTPEPGPARWMTYFSVDDLDAVVKKVESAGGTVTLPATNVGTAGRRAAFVDTTGAPFAAWQAGDHFGAALRNEPGAFVASELGTTDLGKTKAFYSEVFDWTYGGREEYPEGIANGRLVGGLLPTSQYERFGRPQGLDHWLASFDSAEVDADVSRAVGMGAIVLCEPYTNSKGKRYAIIADPQGAPMGIYDY